MKNKRRGMAAGSVAAVMLLAAGCGLGDSSSAKNANSVLPASDSKAIGAGSGYGADYGSGGAGTNPSAGSASAVGGKTGPAGQLAVRDIPEVGSVVTDNAGATLYRFDKDTNKPPKSNCDGDCAAAWPAVPASDVSASEGIDAALIGEVVRTDGSKQLTLGGWPVYRYAKDTQAGDAKGEGVGGTWHALAADGKKAIDQKGGDQKGGDQGGEGEYGAGQNGAEKPKTDSHAGMGDKTGKAGAELSMVVNEKLGKILVDAKGRTLYRFDKDSAWPMKFGCLGACLDTWKPAAPVDKTKASGIPSALVGSVKRPDGSMQLTIDCWPVYLFTGDTEPGQTNGHNKQGLWFAVTDGGKKVPAGG
ncbi:SCO0930 family lipoprotein [Streptomyces sp. NBC_01565]|uniref:SCO0930 family lipoprotein n=1 Tax=unclassified Streptomyces TaxID=2593676 RepID=UPI0022508E05|nr:SCO0930 family lipoprotein [Streptomyces sp. NBC_01565]MCX4540075.1 SCO0930 family lipoprotein [Streptomyces sp. NBC_01565]